MKKGEGRRGEVGGGREKGRGGEEGRKGEEGRGGNISSKRRVGSWFRQIQADGRWRDGGDVF